MANEEVQDLRRELSGLLDLIAKADAGLRQLVEGQNLKGKSRRAAPTETVQNLLGLPSNQEISAEVRKVLGTAFSEIERLQQEFSRNQASNADDINSQLAGVKQFYNQLFSAISKAKEELRQFNAEQKAAQRQATTTQRQSQRTKAQTDKGVASQLNDLSDTLIAEEKQKQLAIEREKTRKEQAVIQVASQLNELSDVLINEEKEKQLRVQKERSKKDQETARQLNELSDDLVKDAERQRTAQAEAARVAQVKGSRTYSSVNSAVEGRFGASILPESFDATTYSDLARGLQRVEVQGKLTDGTMIRLNGHINEFGRFVTEAAEKTSKLTNEFGPLASIKYAFLFNTLFQLQHGFEDLVVQIIKAQNQLVELGQILDRTGGNKNQQISNFLQGSLNAAIETGQPFNEGIQTSILNFKLLGGVQDESKRQDLSNQLTKLQLGSQTAFGLTLDQSLEAVPAIYAQIRDSLSEIEDPAQRSQEAIRQLEIVLSKFTVASRLTGAAGNDLVQTYAQIAQSAQEAGISQDQLIALTASTSVALNKSPAETANSIKALIERTYGEGKDDLSKYGIATQQIQGGQIKSRNFIDIIDQINSQIAKNPGLAQVFGQIIGSQRRAPEALKLFGARRQSLELGLEGTVSNASGREFSTTVQKTSEELLGTFNKLQTAFASFIQRLLYSGGVVNDVEKAFNTLTKTLTGLIDFADSGSSYLRNIKDVLYGLVQYLIVGFVNGTKIGTTATKLFTLALRDNALAAERAAAATKAETASKTGPGSRPGIKENLANGLGTSAIFAATDAAANIFNGTFDSEAQFRTAGSFIASGFGAALGGPVGAGIGYTLAEFFIKRAQEGISTTGEEKAAAVNALSGLNDTQRASLLSITKDQTEKAVSIETLLNRARDSLLAYTSTAPNLAAQAGGSEYALSRTAAGRLYAAAQAGQNLSDIDTSAKLGGGFDILGPQGLEDLKRQLSTRLKTIPKDQATFDRINSEVELVIRDFIRQKAKVQLEALSAGLGQLYGQQGYSSLSDIFTALNDAGSRQEILFGTKDPKPEQVFSTFNSLRRQAFAPLSGLFNRSLQTVAPDAGIPLTQNLTAQYAFDEAQKREDARQKAYETSVPVNESYYYQQQQQYLAQALPNAQKPEDFAQIEENSARLQALPALLGQTSHLAQLLSQDMTGVESAIADLSTQGQQHLQEVIQKFLEAQRTVLEYEATLAQVKATEASAEYQTLSATEAGRQTPQFIKIEEELQSKRQLLSLNKALYDSAKQIVTTTFQNANGLRSVVDLTTKWDQAQRRVIQYGSAAKFQAPGIIDLKGYNENDIQQALTNTIKKQSDLTSLIPGFKEVFSKDQAILQSGEQYRGTTGINPGFFQEFLNQAKEKRTQPANIVDLRKLTPEKLQEALEKAQKLQANAVKLAPDLAPEYEKQRLLILQKNNDILLKLGLSQEFLTAALEDNTDSNELRGHYNLPSGYRPPTVWDYYNDGGTTAGDVNYPSSLGNDQVPLSLVTDIANKSGQSSELLPDIGGLGDLYRGSQPIGYPEPGTPTIYDDRFKISVPFGGAQAGDYGYISGSDRLRAGGAGSEPYQGKAADDLTGLFARAIPMMTQAFGQALIQAFGLLKVTITSGSAGTGASAVLNRSATPPGTSGKGTANASPSLIGSSPSLPRAKP